MGTLLQQLAESTGLAGFKLDVDNKIDLVPDQGLTMVHAEDRTMTQSSVKHLILFLQRTGLQTRLNGDATSIPRRPRASDTEIRGRRLAERNRRDAEWP